MILGVILQVRRLLSFEPKHLAGKKDERRDKNWWDLTKWSFLRETLQEIAKN